MERDDETGFYYIGARYYCPWLARWLAPDPINSEWYNMCKGVPQRNRERQFVELTASSYEYCYANPVRFIDHSGEQATDKIIKESDGLKTITRKQGNIAVSEQIPINPPISSPNTKGNSISSTNADTVLNDAFKEFNIQFNSENYSKAINGIVEKYQLEKIAHKNIMSVQYNGDDGVSTVLETRGVNSGQFTSVTYGDLLKASKNIENFGNLVISLAHEYIHAYQRVNGSPSSHEGREFYANQFSALPNNSIIAREGTRSFNVPFPEGTDSMIFMWASQAIKYYQTLDNDSQKEYETDAKQLLSKGLESYEKIKSYINPSKAEIANKQYKILVDFNNKINHR